MAANASSAAPAGADGPLTTFTGDMVAELPKQEHPGSVDVPTKPEPMDPSFYEALVGTQGLKSWAPLST